MVCKDCRKAETMRQQPRDAECGRNAAEKGAFHESWSTNTGRGGQQGSHSPLGMAPLFFWWRRKRKHKIAGICHSMRHFEAEIDTHSSG